MDHKVLLVFLLYGPGLVQSFHTVVYEYYFINLGVTWAEARQYCRQHYTDLATFRNMDDIEKHKASFTYAWIGLFDDPASWIGVMGNDSNSWRWSATGTTSPGGYQRWAAGNPDYRGGVEKCVLIMGGQWFDFDCYYQTYFVCFTGAIGAGSKTFTLVQTSLGWGDALTHCRKYYTDLAMIQDESENTAVASLTSSPSLGLWLGLYREPWRWSDDNNSSFSNWDSGQPSSSNEHCVVENSGHYWHDATCYFKFPFICHKALKGRITTVYAVLRSKADLSESVITAHILQQLTEKFRNTGLTDVQLKWKIRPQKQ